MGCSAGQPAVSLPVENDNPGGAQTAAQGAQYSMWARGMLGWDEESESITFTPMNDTERTADWHYDVWPFLNPPECYDCVTINVTYHDPGSKIIHADVTFRNPTPLNGFFVRGIVMPDPATSLDLTNPHFWWKPHDYAIGDTPFPFKIFAVENNDWKFGAGESFMQTYEFTYGSLADFSKCEYRVIARWPMNPGEPRRIVYPVTFGGFTTDGGFISFRITVNVDETSPDYTVYAYRVLGDDIGDPVIMRQAPYGEHQTWFMGEPTGESSATIWVLAKMDGYDGCLARKVEIPIEVSPHTPNRTFPIVDSGVGVFVDQLKNGMTDEQTEFMATNAVGSQKLVYNLAESMRAYNPDFIVVQYHLAFGAGDISNIYGYDWIKNWEFENAQEDFFEHRSWSTQPNQRVLQQDWDWYLTDPVSDWVMYFIGNTIERMDPLGDQFDGVFADSASQPWNTDPPKWWEGSDDAHDMFTYWTPKTQSFFDTVAQAYHTLPTYWYLIPNAGSYVTTISDITYFQCDGVMIEGFCHWSPGSYFTEVDWRLQQNRARALAAMDKIILCQTSIDVEDTTDRGFVLGSYMLLQDNYTYLNMLGPWGLEPQWWPEYGWDPGVAVEDWTNVSELQDTGGCYVRHFADGIVIVNPSDDVRYFTTTKMYSHTGYAEGGLLPADGVPTGIATGPLVDAGVQTIAPHSSWLGIG